MVKSPHATTEGSGKEQISHGKDFLSYNTTARGYHKIFLDAGNILSNFSPFFFSSSLVDPVDLTLGYLPVSSFWGVWRLLGNISMGIIKFLGPSLVDALAGPSRSKLPGLCGIGPLADLSFALKGSSDKKE